MQPGRALALEQQGGDAVALQGQRDLPELLLQPHETGEAARVALLHFLPKGGRQLGVPAKERQETDDALVGTAVGRQLRQCERWRTQRLQPQRRPYKPEFRRLRHVPVVRQIRSMLLWSRLHNLALSKLPFSCQ